MTGEALRPIARFYPGVSKLRGANRATRSCLKNSTDRARAQ
jgi:hypothetical protein